MNEAPHPNLSPQREIEPLAPTRQGRARIAVAAAVLLLVAVGGAALRWFVLAEPVFQTVLDPLTYSCAAAGGFLLALLAADRVGLRTPRSRLGLLALIGAGALLLGAAVQTTISSGFWLGERPPEAVFYVILNTVMGIAAAVQMIGAVLVALAIAGALASRPWDGRGQQWYPDHVDRSDDDSTFGRPTP